MLNLKKVFFYFILFSLSTNVYAENKVAYLDIDFILSNTISGKNLLKKLKQLEDVKKEEFEMKEQNLKNEENQILSSRNLISNKALNEKISKFQDKLDEYKIYKTNEIEIIKKNRNKEIMKLLNKINPIIEEFMNDKSIAILIDKKNIFIANKNYDITEDIINKINTSIK